MTSDVAGSHLPELLSGPCGYQRYREINTPKSKVQKVFICIGSGDQARAAEGELAVPSSGPVLGDLKVENHHASGVLPIFQDCPSSLAAQFTVTKTYPRHIYGLFEALGIVGYTPWLTDAWA